MLTLSKILGDPAFKKFPSFKEELDSPIRSVFTTFILYSQGNPNSRWRHYIELLPTNASEFPICYDDSDKLWLEGSSLYDEIQERAKGLARDYKILCKKIPIIADIPFDEFSRMRALIGARLFSVNVQGKPLYSLIPIANLMAHRQLKNTEWFYDEVDNLFVVGTTNDISKGDEIFISYGEKSNFELLLNYGISFYDNSNDEYRFRIEFDTDDPAYMEKRYAFKGPRVEIVVRKDERKTLLKLLGLMRLLALNDGVQFKRFIQGCKLDGAKNIALEEMKQTSIDNESKALALLGKIATGGLSQYSNSLAEDEGLRRSDISKNQLNCLNLRIGEKKILNWYLELSESCLPLLSKSMAEVVEFAQTSPYKDYIEDSIISLLH